MGGNLWLPAIWEPMYMGQVYGFCGMYCSKPFRDEYPLLVPMHIAIYFLAIW